jgi:hypothetical protein
MGIRPELTIGYDANVHPSSATCSLCGARMPSNHTQALSSAESIRRFAAQFDLHVQQKHHAEYKICWASA